MNQLHFRYFSRMQVFSLFELELWLLYINNRKFVHSQFNSVMENRHFC